MNRAEFISRCELEFDRRYKNAVLEYRCSKTGAFNWTEHCKSTTPESLFCTNYEWRLKKTVRYGYVYMFEEEPRALYATNFDTKEERDKSADLNEKHGNYRIISIFEYETELVKTKPIFGIEDKKND